MCILSVKPAPWLAVNLHRLFSNGAAVNTPIGVGIFSHLTIRSDSDSVSHDPIPEQFLIYFSPPLLIN